MLLFYVCVGEFPGIFPRDRRPDSSIPACWCMAFGILTRLFHIIVINEMISVQKIYVELSNFISSGKPNVAIILLLLTCSGVLNGVWGSPISDSTLSSYHAIHSSYQDFYAIGQEYDDTAFLSERDLAPDVLAIGIPASSPFRKAEPLLHPENKNLHLRSSSRNVTGINGMKVFSLPIQVSELASLLSNARIDLQVRDANAETPLYEFNSTKWSFS